MTYAPSPPSEGVGEGGSHEGRWVDPTGMVFSLRDGEQARLYGGLGYRYWLGTPGLSSLVSGAAHFWERILASDQADFGGSLRMQVRERVRAAVLSSCGLLVSDHDLDRIEWLEIWAAEPDLLDRLAAFEQGWSRALPPGRRARDLTGADIGKLTRQMGLHRPRVKRQVTL